MVNTKKVSNFVIPNYISGSNSNSNSNNELVTEEQEATEPVLGPQVSKPPQNKGAAEAFGGRRHKKHTRRHKKQKHTRRHNKKTLRKYLKGGEKQAKNVQIVTTPTVTTPQYKSGNEIPEEVYQQYVRALPSKPLATHTITTNQQKLINEYRELYPLLSNEQKRNYPHPNGYAAMIAKEGTLYGNKLGPVIINNYEPHSPK